MIKSLYSIFVIKMIRTFYYRKLIKTTGIIQKQDILLDIFVSFVLFYSMNIFIDKNIDKTAFIYFTFDSLSVAAFIWSYIIYIQHHNKRSMLEAFQENKNAKDEINEMKQKGQLDKVTVKFKPSSPDVYYLNLNMIQLFCILPYFIVIYE